MSVSILCGKASAMPRTANKTEPPRRKLVVVGDGACGKTCLLISFAEGTSPKVYVPTIFENYVTEPLIDGEHVQLALWDTAGQEDYDRLRPLSYPEAHVILICFALDSLESLENVEEKWLPEVTYFCEKVPIILVGCKKDLKHDGNITKVQPAAGQETISIEKVDELCATWNIYRYFECSALQNDGVEEVFEAAVRAALLSDNSKKTHKKCLWL